MRWVTFRARKVALMSMLLIATSSACTRWHDQPATAATVARIDATQTLRIVSTDGVTVALTGVRISGDTLYGRRPSRDAVEASPLVALPLAEIRQLQQKRTDALSTGLIVAGLLGLSMLFSDSGSK